MGTWGTSLYSNDTTCDVRDTYIEFLQIQLMNNQDAFNNTIKKFDEYFGNPDEEPLFWYAIADTQWKVGRLSKEVKQKALEWIDKKGGIEVWEESKKGGAGWQKTLDKLFEKLNKEQPKEKKFKKLIIPNQNPWNLNDIYAYQIHKEYGPKDKYSYYGKYILLQKIGEVKSNLYNDIVMRIQIYDRLFDKIPSIIDVEQTISTYRLLPFSNPFNQEERFLNSINNTNHDNKSYNQYRPISMSVITEQYHKDLSYPIDKLNFICSLKNSPNIQHERIDGNTNYFLMWDDLNKQIAWLFSLWQNIEYDIIGDGTFEYPTLEHQRQMKAKLNL